MNPNRSTTNPSGTPQSQNPRRLTLVAIASLLLLCVATSMAQPPAGGPGGGERGALAKIAQLLPPPGYLDLDDGQIAATRALLEQLQTTLQPLREQQQAQHQALRDLLDGDAPDATAVGELVISSHGLRQQIRQALEATDAEFSGLLNTDQLVAYENFKELRRLRRLQRQGPGGPDDGLADDPLAP